ncbi:AAA domain-containing protein [Amycolatopsis tolypomycina]|uniref:AAA domain-containing protein n=1 Tax=Amycolatopsis tolypomycina TaxID=208445 RepID=A0A1H4JBC1_9PSEU|nr:AAA family ATPase [Amycolatopsis tolypomycina]SEB43457.1 AAA domain-containing protein [Amycolatopsis tolypomycina]
MSVRHVVLIAGPPCAGKSTLAGQLAQTRPGIVLDRDVIARGLGSTRGWLHEAALTERAEQIMVGEMARIGAADDVVAYVVRSVPTPGARAELAHQLRADVVYVVNPGMGECLRRATAGGRPQGTHAGVREWYRRYGPAGVDRQPEAPRLSTSRAW